MRREWSMNEEEKLQTLVKQGMTLTEISKVWEARDRKTLYDHYRLMQVRASQSGAQLPNPRRKHRRLREVREPLAFSDSSSPEPNPDPDGDATRKVMPFIKRHARGHH